jgi:hypothetical protein
MGPGVSSVSNLSAHQPRNAMRSGTPPRPLSADELGRCGAEHGVREQCVGAALASHGRGHRFETCHAHQAKRFSASLPRAVCQKICQKITASAWSIPARRSASEPLGAINGWAQAPLRPGAARLASASSGNVCPVDDLAEAPVTRISIPPGDVAADHAGLVGVAGVVGAVHGEVAQRVNCASMRLSHDASVGV